MTVIFDSAFYAQLEESFSFSSHFKCLAERAFVDLPIMPNYFLSYMLLGGYHGDTLLPLYLRRENFEVIRNRLDRIEVVHDDCGRYLSSLPSDSISKFNFSNVFEWVMPKAFENILQETIRVAKNEAILTYRNHLVPRSRPQTLAEWIKPMPHLSETLHRKDLSFIYKAYIVERVVKENFLCHSM
jgi:S-adenosylmethionine-diacylglycerol 3-amino-3-carboxypropyl transferase